MWAKLYPPGDFIRTYFRRTLVEKKKKKLLLMWDAMHCIQL
jgi:hypothetical protein